MCVCVCSHILFSFCNHVIIATTSLDQEAALLVDDDEAATWEHGEAQAPGCRNWVFAVLFLLQLSVVLWFSVLGIRSAVSMHADDDNNNDNDNDNDDHGNYFPVENITHALVFGISLLLSILCVSAIMMMLLLGPLAEMMIQVSLVTSPIGCLLASVGFMVVGQIIVAVGLLLMAGIGTWYAYWVWHRIPFAAANIHTAMAAIHENKGLLVMAYGTALLTAGWTLLWGLAVAGILSQHQDWVMECSSSDNDDDNNDTCHWSAQGKSIFVGFLLSLYWTCQVIQNTFHTTIAGVVGTWWFTPQAERPVGCCNTAIYDSWIRSNVYSLGSICLGSLLVAILQVLQFLVRMGRQQQRDEHGNRQNSLFWCLLQCLVDQLERLMEYINQWAFSKYSIVFWVVLGKYCLFCHSTIVLYVCLFVQFMLVCMATIIGRPVTKYINSFKLVAGLSFSMIIWSVVLWDFCKR